MVEIQQSEVRRPGCVKDARGKVVTLLDPYALHVLRRHDVIPAEPLAVIARQSGFGLPKWQYRGFVASVAIFSACIVFLIVWKLVRGAPVDRVERVLWPLNLAVFALGAIQFWRSGQRARQKRVCTIMLKHRRCPHCGYDLRGLPTDPGDQVTICPECGSAWRFAEAGAAEQPGAGR
jgi:hypothetical protein